MREREKLAVIVVNGDKNQALFLYRLCVRSCEI